MYRKKKPLYWFTIAYVLHIFQIEAIEREVKRNKIQSIVTEVKRNKIQSIVAEVLADEDEFVENRNLKQRTSLTKPKPDVEEKLAELFENFKKR